MYSAKRILLVIFSIVLSLNAAAAGNTSAESYFSDTESVNITITPGKGHKKISPYIYGINDTVSMSDVTASVIKQTGVELSTYNWENNYANLGADSGNKNSLLLANREEEEESIAPALYTSELVTKANKYNIPLKLVTLPMLGYAAADSGGTVMPGFANGRFFETSFDKGDSYLLEPDTEDDKVYIDEYLFYLAAVYGYNAEGGVNGYFLDREPELWDKNFPVLNLEPLTANYLINKSKSLAKTVKNIDSTAQIYGPSIKNISAYVNLNNSDDWDSYSSEYSWFIDYYLSEFSKEEQTSGKRLLDVLDLHYITEAYTLVNTPVISTNDELANKERMQSVRTLWDSNYTENSTSVLLHKQHTPLIPTLQASIRIFYPGTKLSFSEYSFGGGSNISGGIAQADVLGIFASNDVYMACLLPDTNGCSYQKSAINIYTNYDGKGSSFGNTLVKSDNGGDNMSAVYSSIGNEDGHKSNSIVKSVILNKNYSKNKKAYIKLDSKVEFTSAKVYSFDSSSPKIKYVEDITNIKDNDFYYTMTPLTVYMFEFFGSDTIEEDKTSNDVTDDSSSVTKTQTIPEQTEVSSDETVVSVSSEAVTSDNSSSGPLEESSTVTQQEDQSDNDNVPIVVKIIVSGLVAAVIVVMIYIFVFDKSKTK
jgi:hypothetical protein